jgi:Metallo-beta-lactamase superfamily
LVLLVGFILESGAQQAAGHDADAVLTHASNAIADAGLGGVVLLMIIIVVATMVTQAFSFEAIRLLEGYWGPGLDLPMPAGVLGPDPVTSNVYCFLVPHESGVLLVDTGTPGSDTAPAAALTQIGASWGDVTTWS